jgi:2-methylcitrate dehydratase PrpD
MKTLTEAFAEMAIETKSEDLPEAAVLATKRLILDTVATIIAGWKEPGIPPVVKRMQSWGGVPEATILTYGIKVPSPNAAFANGCMSHALDYDDAYFEASLHIMASVLPVSLAIGEIVDASGQDIIEAVALGVEVAGRIGVVMQAASTSYGYLPSSVVGGWGATLSACRLLGLNVEQTVNALGINYAQASGNRQALLDTTLTKRIQPAFAGRSALWAAVLAADGVTGPHRALEGEAGFFKLYVGCEPPSLEEMTAAHDYWQIERFAIKPYPSCGGNHKGTQAAITLAIEEDLDPADIERAEVWVPYIDVWFVGQPFEIREDPQVDAQFSVAYSTALGLVRRKAGLEQYRAENVVSDKAVLDLAQRIQVCEIPNSKSLRTHECHHEVKVWTRDGRELSRRVQIVHGQWQDPFSFEDTEDKLRECAQFAGLWSTARIEELIATLGNLEGIRSMRSFVETQLVVPGADQQLQS